MAEPEEDLFRGHDPAEVEERLIEVFSDMPCDLSADDMKSEEEDEEEWAEAQKLCERVFAEKGNSSRVHLNRGSLRVWLAVAIERGRHLERRKKEAARAESKTSMPTRASSMTAKSHPRTRDTANARPGLALKHLGERVPKKK